MVSIYNLKIWNPKLKKISLSIFSFHKNKVFKVIYAKIREKEKYYDSKMCLIFKNHLLLKNNLHHQLELAN